MKLKFRIRTLLVVTAIAGAALAFLGHAWNDLHAENRFLLRLELAGAKVDATFEKIPKWYEDLGAFRRTIYWPLFQLYGEGIDTRCRSLAITFVDAHDKPARCSESLTSLGNLKYLKQLQLGCHCSDVEFESLTQLRHLEKLGLSESNCGDSVVDFILGFEKLSTVRFGKNKISMQNFDRLTATQLFVLHEGLHDFQLDKQFLRYSGCDYPVGSGCVQAILDGKTGELEYQFNFKTTDHKYAPNFDPFAVPPSFVSCRFDFDQGWKNLIRFSDGPTLPPATHLGKLSNNDYFKTDVYDFEIQFLSREKNVFHIKCRCKIENQDQICEMDLHLPFTGITITNPWERNGPAELTELIAKHFNIDEFVLPPKSAHIKTWKTIPLR